jgi:diguanylate cyclase (GGDEF)-like protein
MVAGLMLFMAAYAALALASIDPSLATLAQTGPPRPDQLGWGRLAFLALALLVAPAVAGVRLMWGLPTDGAFLIVAASGIVLLVMLRVGMLAQQVRRSQAALRHLATHDALTDVLNRRGFTDALAAELRSPDDCVLIFCDLDDFKRVNDSYGHAAGDRLLAKVAQRLRQCIRQSDALCRLGGDEFVILLRSAGATEVAQVRQRINEALRQPFRIAEVDVTIAASLGSIVSRVDQRDSVTADFLIDQADTEMYIDKAAAADGPMLPLPGNAP